MLGGFRRLLLGGLLGKVLGVVREVLLAALLGTGAQVAAYRVSQTAALIPINLLNADLLAVGYLPQHARVVSTPRLAWALYDLVRTWVVLAGLLTFAVLAGFSPLWAFLLAPGFDGDAAELTAAMIIVTAAAVPFYAYVSVVSYLAMARGIYRLAALRPTVQSLGLIVATLLAFATGNALWLAAGFLAAYALMAIWAAILARGLRRASPWGDPATRAEKRELRGALWRAVRPYLLVPLLVQGVWVAERALTSLIGVVAVAALDYARVITDTVIALVAGPLGLSVLATQSGESKARRHAVATDVVHILLVVGIPVSALLLAAGPFLVEAVFARGAFGPDSVATTSAFLAGLSLGLWAHLAGQVMIRFLNAESRNTRAAIAVACGAAVTIVADVLLFRPLGAFGIGLGASIGGVVQLSVAAVALGLGRRLMSTTAVLAIPFALTCASVAYAAAAGEPATRAMVAIGALGLWTIWVLAVPTTRRAAISTARRMLSRQAPTEEERP
jgi:peptidoglycan biosynthesis protein MviN/MurJ (putative lipid II flippase)